MEDPYYVEDEFVTISLEEEKSLKIETDSLSQSIRDIISSCVFHFKENYDSFEAIYLATVYVARYVTDSNRFTTEVLKGSAISLAAKYVIGSLSATSVAGFSTEIKKHEVELVCFLDWNLSCPTPAIFYRHFCSVFGVVASIEDLNALNGEIVDALKGVAILKYLPSEIAAAAVLFHFGVAGFDVGSRVLDCLTFFGKVYEVPVGVVSVFSPEDGEAGAGEADADAGEADAGAGVVEESGDGGRVPQFNPYSCLGSDCDD